MTLFLCVTSHLQCIRHIQPGSDPLRVSFKMKCVFLLTCLSSHCKVKFVYMHILL